ncbi:hypothetical protein [Aliiroseovarius lamellibrachiae]|uniref:hypothetical protein n=1 Tax=Aliiroseovarius lamellibrachiae TaxID=1924933 RepID=UPI001BE09118|nr:hypothetical protein [Aliiroseovarius lamellibrachiae]MBT2132182.1 hypothetical protein [Aliiroseovarius lamellibrachiae]
MRIRILAVSAMCLGLTACGGGTNLNPLSWFQRSGPKDVALIPAGGFLDAQDQRLLVAEVVEMKVLQASGGVIIRAKGLPPRLGYWDAELVSNSLETPEKGVLTYEFRISEPPYHTNTGRAKQREVFVGHFVSNAKLRNATSIRVLGTGNSRSMRVK